MFVDIVTAIRGEILHELNKRVRKGTRYVFHSFSDDGEDRIYAEICVGRPTETDYFPDVMSVWRSKDGDVMVTVQDECGNEIDYGIRDFFLDLGDLAEILDAMIEGKPVPVFEE